MNPSNHLDPVSREMQNAFVDGQLDAAEWTAMLERIGADAELRRDICELRATKDMVRSAYSGVVPRARRPAAKGGWRSWGIAATLVVAVAAGWVSHGLVDSGREWSGAVQRAAALPGVSENRVLVHVASGGDERLARTLDEVEDLLRSARASGRALQVEVVANSTGLDLLRVDASPYHARVATLRGEYSNLTFLACNQAIERLHERGVTVELLPGVHVTSSALELVVKRLHGGWVYIRA
jgi:intracellular sulfur oxidation DsrE/DsrF family protein